MLLAPGVSLSCSDVQPSPTCAERLHPDGEGVGTAGRALHRILVPRRAHRTCLAVRPPLTLGPTSCASLVPVYCCHMCTVTAQPLPSAGSPPAGALRLLPRPSGPPFPLRVSEAAPRMLSLLTLNLKHMSGDPTHLACVLRASHRA